MFACSAWSSRPTSAWINMFPAFVQHVSTGFTNFDEFNGHWMMSLQRRLSTLLSQPGWTAATWYSLGHWRLSLTVCSGYLMLLYTSLVECASTTVDCRSCYIPTCTGSMWQIESITCSPLQSTGFCITRCQSTWHTAVSLSRTSLFVRDCAQSTIASWMCCTINEQHLPVGRSLSLDQQFGICFRTS